MGLSNKSNAKSVTYMCLSWEKNRYALYRGPYGVQEITPKQIIHRDLEGNDTENSEEDTSNEYKEDHASNFKLKPARRWGYWCQDYNSEDELKGDGKQDSNIQ